MFIKICWRKKWNPSMLPSLPPNCLFLSLSAGESKAWSFNDSSESRLQTKGHFESPSGNHWSRTQTVVSGLEVLRVRAAGFFCPCIPTAQINISHFSVFYNHILKSWGWINMRKIYTSESLGENTPTLEDSTIMQKGSDFIFIILKQGYYPSQCSVGRSIVP